MLMVALVIDAPDLNCPCVELNMKVFCRPLAIVLKSTVPVETCAVGLLWKMPSPA